MLGRLIGEVLALPVRIVNVPVRVANKLVDGDLPDPLGDVADAIEDGTAEAIDGDDD